MDETQSFKNCSEGYEHVGRRSASTWGCTWLDYYSSYLTRYALCAKVCSITARREEKCDIGKQACNPCDIGKQLRHCTVNHQSYCTVWHMGHTDIGKDAGEEVWGCATTTNPSSIMSRRINTKGLKERCHTQTHTHTHTHTHTSEIDHLSLLHLTHVS